MAKFTLASINSRRQKITQALAGLDLSLPQVIYTARTKSLNYRWGSAMGLHSNLSLLRGSGTWDHQILKISQLLQKNQTLLLRTAWILPPLQLPGFSLPF